MIPRRILSLHRLDRTGSLEPVRSVACPALKPDQATMRTLIPAMPHVSGFRPDPVQHCRDSAYVAPSHTRSGKPALRAYPVPYTSKPWPAFNPERENLALIASNPERAARLATIRNNADRLARIRAQYCIDHHGQHHHVTDWPSLPCRKEDRRKVRAACQQWQAADIPFMDYDPCAFGTGESGFNQAQMFQASARPDSTLEKNAGTYDPARTNHTYMAKQAMKANGLD